MRSPSELAGLQLDDIQPRQGHWAIVDLIGKGGHVRTVPIPHWAKQALDEWISGAGITKERIFRAVARGGKVWGSGISENVVWYVVRSCCQRAGLKHIAPHDLRRTCAKLFHTNGGELEQIQFLLGHASVLTTERYLGCKQNLGQPVNDLFDLKTNVQTQETSPGSTAPQATAIEAPSAEDVVREDPVPDKKLHSVQEVCPQNHASLADRRFPESAVCRVAMDRK